MNDNIFRKVVPLQRMEDNGNGSGKLSWLLIFITAVLTAINVTVYSCDREDRKFTVERTVHDTVTETDTEYISSSFSFLPFAPKTRTFVRWDTLRLKDTGNNNALTLPIERLEYNDEVITEDSCRVRYRASVTGYNPSLDTISFDLTYPKITETNTVTVTERVIQKAPRVSVGVQTGFGYGVFNKKPDLYVGFGLSYRF